MPELNAYFFVEKLTAFALLLTSFELLQLQSNLQYKKLWSFEKIQNYLHQNFSTKSFMLRFLFSDLSLKIQQILLATAAIATIAFGGSIALWVCAFILFLLQAIRFRGTFNGGSDMMIMVLITGSLISSLFPKHSQLGLHFIAIHLYLSYLKAGTVKLSEGNWRSGKAIGLLLQNYSLISKPILQRLQTSLQKNSLVSFFASWMIMLFEISIALVFVWPTFAWFYFAIAMVFHFCNFWCFGLNRFFWAWLAAWPALLGVTYGLK